MMTFVNKQYHPYEANSISINKSGKLAHIKETSQSNHTNTEASLSDITTTHTSLAVVRHSEHESEETLGMSAFLQQHLRVAGQSQKEAEGDEGVRGDGGEGGRRLLTGGLSCLGGRDEHRLVDVLQPTDRRCDWHGIVGRVVINPLPDSAHILNEP